MREAVDAVQVLGMSVSKAASMHGIPRTTLSDHCCARVLPGAKAGHPTILSCTEEQDLVQFLISSAEIGCARTRQEVLLIVNQMLSRRDAVNKESVTIGWWNRFTKRHPQLSLRTPATLSLSRARASTQESIGCYFDLFEKILDDHCLHEQPSLIYNMDETGFPLDPRPLKTIHEKGEKNPISLTSGSKSQVTVVACVSASGQTIPPLIIWKRKTMSPDMANGEIPGTQYGFSDTGWMKSKLFDSWFKKQFLRYAPASRPLILLLDGHSSHYCPDTLKLAAENGVIIVALPPNTTHLTQPLDKGVFGPFKVHWKRVCHDYQVSHPGRVINDYNFCSLFSKAWIESMTCVNIIAGFRTTGVYPVNRDAIQLPGTSEATEGIAAPRQVFTPFKRDPGLFSSNDIPPVPTVNLSKRPNSLTDIVNQPTPKLTTRRIRPDSGGVMTGSQLRRKAAAQTPQRRLKSPVDGKSGLPKLRILSEYFEIFDPRRAYAARVTIVGLSVCVCVCPLVNISRLEHLFILKTLSYTQRAAKVKMIGGISLELLRCRDTPLPASYGSNKSAILYVRIKCMR